MRDSPRPEHRARPVLVLISGGPHYGCVLVPEGGSRSHTHTHRYLECGGIVPGHVDMGLGQAMERGKTWAAPLCPALEAMAVLRVGALMGMWAEANLPFQGSPLTSCTPLPQDSVLWGSLLWEEPCMARAQASESGRPGLQPWISAFQAVCL